MDTETAIERFLNEYQARLGIDGSASILVLQTDIASALQQWCGQLSSISRPLITTLDKETPIVTDWPYQETEFSHTFASIKAVDKDSLQFLKWIQYSLCWKGIAVLLFDPQQDYQHDQLLEWIERASFERGKIRILEQDSSQVRVAFAMKWDLLSA